MICYFLLHCTQTSTVLQQKVDSLELDLEAMKSAESMHKEEEKSWKKTRQMLENDVESAETLLDKTKIQLEAEQKSRCALTYIHMYVCV